jgi:eukaryotic-like serine/threonine-protein kinase
LRSEVESLLALDAAGEQFLDSPAFERPMRVRPEAPGPSLTGRRFAAYEILSLIGAGGMGQVYRARDLRLKREVAIKFLHGVAPMSAQRLHRFEQEAITTARLSHPNIVAVFDVGSYEGAPYIVAELLKGESLRDELRGSALPVRKALDYARRRRTASPPPMKKGSFTAI